MSADRGRPHLAMGAGAEFNAIRAMIEAWGSRASGIGDDAALLAVPPGEQLVASTDASVEGVHFRREWLTPEEIGGRAAAAALSDLAAMGAAPLGLLLALGVPEGWEPSLTALARGVGETASRVACPIVGGNIARASELSLTVTVLGSALRPLTRSGARAGDALFVTGSLGGPGAALRALLQGRVPEPAHRARFAAPAARIAEARWLAEHGATAAIDISDGLAADAEHLARASGVSVDLEIASLPRVEGVTPEDAAENGEEYELLVALPGDAALGDEFAARFGLPLTRVGVVGHARAGAHVTGVRVDRARGHDHLL